MILAFILINCEVTAEEEVFKEIAKIEEVKEASTVYGIYDIVAKIEAPDPDRVKEVVFSKIRRIDRVRSTLTLIVAESAKK